MELMKDKLVNYYILEYTIKKNRNSSNLRNRSSIKERKITINLITLRVY